MQALGGGGGGTAPFREGTKNKPFSTTMLVYNSLFLRHQMTVNCGLPQQALFFSYPDTIKAWSHVQTGLSSTQ